VYHINKLKNHLGSQESTMMLFVHAFTGRDSTSRIFGVGKKSVFHKVMKGDGSLKSCARAFTTPGQITNVIVQAGHKAWSCCLVERGRYAYCVAPHHLNKESGICYVICNTRASATNRRGTKHHSLRMYFQIMTWMGEEADLEPIPPGGGLQL